MLTEYEIPLRFRCLNMMQVGFTKFCESILRIFLSQFLIIIFISLSFLQAQADLQKQLKSLKQSHSASNEEIRLLKQQRDEEVSLMKISRSKIQVKKLNNDRFEW